MNDREMWERIAILETRQSGLDERMTASSRTISQQLTELGMSLSGQIDSVNVGVKDTRRILDLHLTKDEEWMDKHSVIHAREDGARDAQRELRKGDMAFLVFAIGLIVALIQVGVHFI